MLKKNIANKILESIDMLLAAAQYLDKFIIKNNYSKVEMILKIMEDLLREMDNNLCLEKEVEGINDILLAIESICYSINRIVKLANSRSLNILVKIEFELVPLIEEMKLNFYFWGCVYPDENLMDDYYKDKMVRFSANKYIDESELIGKYKYDLSIIITGYNKLEYTKMCVESLLKYIPTNINYELILRNHGSDDGTKEYYESICPTKQIDIFKNGGGGNAVFRIIEGRYTLHISNDVIVTENAIENMIKCIESDEKIAWVVPTTPNVSNLQAIEAEYSDISEMHKFARKNNVSNFSRWEQRVRLCNPIELSRSSVSFSSKGIGYGRLYHSNKIFSFSDDVISLCMRRNGYRMMLAKDAYCYHFGSVTLKSTIEEEFYINGRKAFFNTFGIDPWGVGFCYDHNLFKHLNCDEVESVNILGINCGIGSNPLKIKEQIKEKTHNLDVRIYNLTDCKNLVEDLNGVSDYVKEISIKSNFKYVYNNVKFKYIIFESDTDKYNMMKIIPILKEKLIDGGFLCILNTKFEGAIGVDSASYNGFVWYVFKKIINS